jgi:hypothetical protein
MARVWIGGEYIKAQYDQDTNFRPIAQQAIANVTAANLG